LEFSSKIWVTKLKNTLENLEVRINASSPQEILKRGYSLTLHNGQVVKQADGLEGQEIETVLNAGCIKSRITEVESITEDLWQKRS
jgi:exodeoxyribonuclease VII large subunit